MSVSFLFKPMIFSLLFEVIADNNRITAFVIDGFVGIDQGPVLLLINFPLVGFHRFLFRSDRFNEKLGRDGNRQVLIVDIPTAEIFGRIHLQDIVVYLSGEIISLIGRFIINEIVRFIFKGIASYYIAVGLIEFDGAEFSETSGFLIFFDRGPGRIWAPVEIITGDDGVF